MKIFRCCLKYTLQQQIFFVFLTLWLLSLVKLLDVRRLLFPPRDLYLVEFTLSTSPFVRHRYTHLKDADRDEVNCSAVFEQEPLEIGKSLEIRKRHIIDLEDEDVMAMTRDCDIYQALRQYDPRPVSREERHFPIAYSLVVHKDAIMVERLLRAIYTPHNVYCIHYDLKSPVTFKVAMNNLAKCFSNVFIASKLEAVQYAHVSRLQADLNCLSDLLKSSVQWKYVINLCGQDFPLKSNFELVSELKKLNGANMLETIKPPSSKTERFMYHHELRQVPYNAAQVPVRTKSSKGAPPHGIEIFVGSAYFVLSHAFVNYVSNSSLVKDFFAWSQDTYSPDEHFWATLIRVPGVPGEISRSAPDVTDLQSKTRLVKWNYYEGYLYPSCTGSHLRSVCIYGAAELRWLMKDGHWFANKFDSKVDPVLTKCLAEKLEEQQREWITLSSKTSVTKGNPTCTSLQ
ncbi:beta-1,3-galactosyl-O-glycosyl-glycoprotein beta-1,6-N-acetylglucosaminyltransferase 4 [Ochotona princeps]|uniref:beta-1,3-galactosyl-O-glycosyl-glycoprotein beta-1,6-N-acetylglucosaminyltransferase 4 n=1 Tax=Ochotona princeps TaxID=9978 RepID=UPI0027145FA4|nr:beta-1,3-galactosyl-O-glycosyl-glycoprotein beta-1,6-N-acetylglucosaminyltransferase 4 [Ochotona princeps]XP_058512373.1 beta-1,3-galactosyl-O-glycosyl-glycoprotein beta-1,6-N-acetylglucosaminyltransferase 4 [Ochotona princeps]XP_058512374.1 beta-1,3-galactosyl-O-glycosyl-glycoprotein beta-1,6-N-acetylglucosaminyltransferase 4 [Ochotona princeps]XP_058512375.1 beta-1,3-galactosyl-O-glycosyl-glycoprotein beta-1,6-N-acetylglucosaminyltransferase 4 [Ochotona princeps]XP_058512376.1 beta-1,3-gal